MKYKFIILALLAVDFILLLKIVLGDSMFLLFHPQGPIAFQERNLMITATLLMLIIVIPVFIVTFFVASKYKTENTKNKYSPDWDHSYKLQALMWGFPTAIIIVLSVINWVTAHKLDPHIALAVNQKPITIQVVAL